MDLVQGPPLSATCTNGQEQDYLTPVLSADITDYWISDDCRDRTRTGDPQVMSMVRFHFSTLRLLMLVGGSRTQLFPLFNAQLELSVQCALLTVSVRILRYLCLLALTSPSHSLHHDSRLPVDTSNI